MTKYHGENKKLISLVIPAFNSENYIARCINSLVKSIDRAKIQSEIIVVDNGSTDETIKVIHKLAKNHPGLISVLRCNTPGAGAARNLGAQNAVGKYLWFIDADDEVREDSIEKLFSTAEKEGADLVMMGAKRIYPDGHTDYLSAVKPNEKDYRGRFVRYGVGPWQLLIRRAWWVKHNFLFRERMIHEDMEIMSSLILYTDAFAAVDEPFYLYYQNDGSVLHAKTFSPRIFDIFEALEGLMARFKSAGAEQKYYDSLEWFFIWNLLIDSAKDFVKFPEGRGGFKSSREMLRRYFPHWRKNRFLREKPLRLRLVVLYNYFRNW